ncbi:3-oxoacyl-[acyl-carrier-protein] synthase 2 [Enhygromyxa salina]|uniref:3-oxoacyl-[acyl-carrier-protein] synthase 2 n=1 Tax=Enhygromyxa salina TaxID=215803 RepID=A0A2S9YLC2_9BACT|nr:beta-ketoacyl synthase N-terminal-like domain-containing protein [Enhygromyxa salina]PRQ05836.1 3-oxoacyl-[acyl-carrier-protein] synthase 2 [Enhygromyxa salina]
MGVGICGLSVWTCFGRGPAALSEAMAQSDRRFEQVAVAADIEDPWFKTKRGMQLPIPASIVSSWRGRELPVTPFDWPAQFAIETALDAVVDAGRVTQRYPSERIAVCNGTSHGSNHGLLEYLRQTQAGEPNDPSLLLDLPSIIAARIAQVVGASGPSLTFNTACSAGLNAIGQGLRLIESGRADCVIAGGHDTFSLLSFAGFTSLKALDPRGARPFDLERDGLSLGDGAAYVVLEREAAIRARGARARAWIGGYGYLGEAYHPTAPDPEGRGVELAMRRALAEVSGPERLALVSAHGTGTPANDEAELRAIDRVAEAIGVTEPVDVVSLKSQTGHSLGAAGAVQSVAAILNMERGLVPANITLDQPVAHGPKLRLPTQPAAREIPVAVCNGLGFGGSVAALALVHPEHQP